MVNLEELVTEGGRDLALSRTSYIGLKAGDLIMFGYLGSSRLGLVVKSKRTSSGYFLSTQNNTLLNVFLLESITSGMFEAVVNNLYKNRIRCTYKNTPRILGSFVGHDNFRTFNTSKIDNLFSLSIN